MYYEENVINGILCHRSTPDGEWEQFTVEALTTAFISTKSALKSAENTIINLNNAIDEIKLRLLRL